VEVSEILSKQSLIIQILNTFGLALLGIGVVILYKALVSRSNLLNKSLADLRNVYDSVVLAMKKRSEEIDQRFEDEKKFRSLYLSIVEDAEAHKAKIKAWKEDELSVLQNRMHEMSERSRKLEEDYEMLKAENYNLRKRLEELSNDYSIIKTQNQRLLVELGTKYGVKM
jgi:chromosome segregation ATPase